MEASWNNFCRTNLILSCNAAADVEIMLSLKKINWIMNLIPTKDDFTLSTKATYWYFKFYWSHI